jgi:hypothetical protein
MADNHNKWGTVDWQAPPEPLALASRPDGKTPYRPPAYSNVSVPERTRELAISEAALRSLGPERRAQVEEEILKKSAVGGDSRIALGTAVAAGRQSLIKTAAASELGGQLHIAGRGNTTNMMPNLYSPLFLTANLQLPRDRITANAWNRAFYETNPLVRNAINLHATYPISKMTIKCKDKKIERKYLEMAKRVDLFNVVQQVALEYWMIGEVFPYAEYDETRNMWSKVYCHNPDYVVVKRTPVPGESIIALKPDPKLLQIVQSNDPVHRAYRDKMDPGLLDAIARNEYIPLDNFNISHLKNESTAYNTHGSSVIVSVWKDLVLWDLFRENKFIQADAMVNPMTLVKVGASNADGHYPRQEELAAMRDVFEHAQYDKDFKVFTHPDVTIERVGFNGGILDISADLNFILDNIFIGLMVPKAVITQEGASYASASVALDVIRQRYNNFRTKMTNWLVNKIFAPMAEANDFYETIDGQKHLVLPDVEWNQMTLYDVDTYIGHLLNLIDKTPPTTPVGVSRGTVYRSLGLDFQDELANQRKETIQMAILAKEMAAIAKMSLSELRTLDPDAPIIEKDEAPLPGVGAETGAEGGAPPDMGAGLPPDMGAGPPPGGAEPPLPPM